MLNGATKIAGGIRSADKDGGDQPPPKKLLKLSSSAGSVTVSQVVVSPIQVFNASSGGGSVGMQPSNGGLATIELSNANGKSDRNYINTM